MKIDYSFLTGKVYAQIGKNKFDITDEVVTAIQILLHNNIKFNKLHSKLENKTYELCINEVIE